MLNVDAFLDELEKIAEEGKKKKHWSPVQHAALGAAIAPVASGVSNYIQRGHITPANTPMKRWLPATMAFGAMMSGPAAYLHRKMDE